VAWLIRQFTAYVDLEISGQKESDMVDTAIVGLALSDQKNLEAALRIGEAREDIKGDVARGFLEGVKDGLESFARQQSEEWEVVETWPAGNWIEKPAKKRLPLLLRKKTWPALVGVGIQAEQAGQYGPWGVFIGICGPTQDEFNKGVDNTRFYGGQSKFVGLQSRQRIADETGLKQPEGTWWVQWEPLRDTDGTDLSDWRDITTVKLLYDRDGVSKHVIERITGLATKIAAIVIDDT